MSSTGPDFSIFFEQLTAPCAILDENLCFVEVNEMYLETLLSRRDDLIGVSVLEAFPETPERQKLIETSFRQALKGEKNSLSEFVYRIPEVDKADGMREIWWTIHSFPIADADGKVHHFGLRVEDVTAEVQTRQLKDAIAGELQHRVGNLLSLISTIARRTAEHSDDMKHFLSNFDARIESLARTHKLLTGGNWDGMTMERLVLNQLEAYIDQPSERIVIEGPELRLSAVEAQAISMAVHELSTNSAKYGALATSGSALHVIWELIGEDGYQVEWREEGLEDIQQPTKQGFGSLILTKILPSQLNGRAAREFTPTSHSYRLVVESRQPAS